MVNDGVIVIKDCNFFRHTAAAAKLPFYKNVANNMWRWRRRVQKRGAGKIKSIRDYVEYFRTPAGQALLKYSPDRELSFELVHDGEKEHLIFFDRKTLEDLKDSTELSGDSTFSARPKINGVNQLLTITARSYDKVRLLLTITEDTITISRDLPHLHPYLFNYNYRKSKYTVHAALIYEGDYPVFR